MLDSPATRRGILIAVILAGALALRVGFVASQPSFRPFADAASYDQTAVAVADTGGYPPSTIAPSGGPTAFRPPAYPYLLAALYRLTGTTHSSSRFVLARLLSAVLSTGTVALIGVIAGLLWGWGVPTRVAMAFAAIYPPLITIGDSMLSEPLFTLLVLAAVASVLAARRLHPLRWGLVAGALIGLATLTRSNGIIIVVPLAAGLLPARWTRSALAPMAALLAAALFVLTPWLVRDAIVFHQFVPVSTQDGFAPAGTYNEVSRTDKSDPARWIVPTMPPYNGLRRGHENEAELEGRFRSTVLKFIGRHPGYVFEVAYRNLGRLLELEGPNFEHPAAAESGLGLGASDVDVYSFYVLGVLALAAAALGGLSRAPAFVWGVPVAIAVSLIFVIADMRYRLPIDPFLILLVAAPTGAVTVARWRRRH